ncbi:MAG: O-antigen ligase family protein [Candidatus Thiodiazotropha sp. (ex Lucinoma borealis)]|nr:O-antigen ligase family protein [Candidatus Thiodiazotropha sp. (ex Lucinoma borealis)]MCU7838021.1 O-antigen ligase family protein [Candidatus Thiodiazotropha sp. (ex Troendleina suluensis)]MCU7869182.1 O-antigen ligase family protein [Candidatus Thiodiazotropha sp. (ex Lucinoma borealis)]
MLYIGLLISLFLDYVRPDTYLSIIGILKINTIIPVIVLVGALFHVSVNDNKNILKHPNTKWLLFLLFLLAVSVLVADVTEFAFKIFKLVFGFVLWYYIIVKLVTDVSKIKGIFTVFVISHVILIFLNPNVVLEPATRTYIQGNAFLGDGNDYALSASLAIPMCLFLIQDSNKLILRSIYIVSLIILILAIVGTQSRGASLALMGTFGYLWWMGRQKIMGLLLIGGVLLAIISFAPPVYFERMNTISNYENEGSAMGRIVAWKTAVRMVSAYPVTGVGAGHFPVKLGTEFRPPEFGDENFPWLTAHSSYFLILGELGVPGIVFFLGLLIGNYWRNSKAIKSARKYTDSGGEGEQYRKLFLMLNASLVAFIIGGAFLSVTYYPHIYVLAGLFVAAEFMYKKVLSENPMSK